MHSDFRYFRRTFDPLSRPWELESVLDDCPGPPTIAQSLVVIKGESEPKWVLTAWLTDDEICAFRRARQAQATSPPCAPPKSSTSTPLLNPDSDFSLNLDHTGNIYFKPSEVIQVVSLTKIQLQRTTPDHQSLTQSHPQVQLHTPPNPSPTKPLDSNKTPVKILVDHFHTPPPVSSLDPLAIHRRFPRASLFNSPSQPVSPKQGKYPLLLPRPPCPHPPPELILLILNLLSPWMPAHLLNPKPSCFPEQRYGISHIHPSSSSVPWSTVCV